MQSCESQVGAILCRWRQSPSGRSCLGSRAHQPIGGVSPPADRLKPTPLTQRAPAMTCRSLARLLAAGLVGSACVSGAEAQQQAQVQPSITWNFETGDLRGWTQTGPASVRGGGEPGAVRPSGGHRLSSRAPCRDRRSPWNFGGPVGGPGSPGPQPEGGGSSSWEMTPGLSTYNPRT